ncbi:hypothetical protein GOODEAATRI_026128 [Goodea atripinnis]|uniref:Uncharacterized protein n=1 Tax=Goodea atripinnis TaxID=208336 RepID=A0ABV0PRS1_9TELE
MQDAGIISLDLLGYGGAVVDVPGSTLRLGMEVVTVIHLMSCSPSHSEKVFILSPLVFSVQLVYFVVGNLNTLSYPESADLPPFVRENHGMGSSSNSDRIIISYQVKTRVVEKVYVTEHDYGDIGQFRSDGTHEVSPELIRVLQNSQLDLSSFLTQMGYYEDEEMFQDTEEMQDPSVQMMLRMMQNDPRDLANQTGERNQLLMMYQNLTNERDQLGVSLKMAEHHLDQMRTDSGEDSFI